MAENVLLIEENAGIALLTLNRPEVMNAFNFDLLRALKEQIETLSSRPDVRVIIITGAGKKAFSAGADLKERLTLSESRVREYVRTIRNIFSAVEQLNKPVIAAINGIAYGAGTELALASDICIASSNARLGLIQSRLANIPGGGGTQRLPRLVGKGKAKELIYTGRIITAQEALEIGLVNKVCEPEKLINEAFGIASLIVRNSAVAVEQAKYAINRGFEVDLKTGFDIETESYTKTIW